MSGRIANKVAFLATVSWQVIICAWMMMKLTYLPD